MFHNFSLFFNRLKVFTYVIIKHTGRYGDTLIIFVIELTAILGNYIGEVVRNEI